MGGPPRSVGDVDSAPSRAPAGAASPHRSASVLAPPNWVTSVSAAPAEHALTTTRSSAPAPTPDHTTASGRRRRSWPRAVAALEVRDYRLYLSAQMVATTG